MHGFGITELESSATLLVCQGTGDYDFVLLVWQAAHSSGRASA
jgi:hypothetical protein